MKLRFMRKMEESSGIWSFFFEPAETITWKAGQSIRLELPRKSFGISERRFTIASAPHENHVRITTRISTSEFKQYLNTLNKGDEVQGYNIEGDFIWGKSKNHRLLIAAGIGITPYRAMLADQVHKGKPLNATLIYGSSKEPIVFQEEIAAWQKQDDTFQVRYLVGERIAVNEQSTIAPFWLNCLVYVSGPSSMVDGISTALLKNGVQEASIKRDQFTGYDTI
jgi:ferredoxin-NADP reductase